MLAETHAVMKSAEWLNDLTSYETTSIAMCVKCHRHANLYQKDWMTMPHEKPHLLIWVKYSTYPYWPALLIKVTGNKAFVRFFGDESHAWATVSNCFLYSRERPHAVQGKTDTAIKNQVNKGIQVRVQANSIGKTFLI